jgi:hypothetical protein
MDNLRVPNTAEELLTEVFEKGWWEHSRLPGVDSVYIIPGDLKDRISLYLQENRLIGVQT